MFIYAEKFGFLKRVLMGLLIFGTSRGDLYWPPNRMQLSYTFTLASFSAQERDHFSDHVIQDFNLLRDNQHFLQACFVTFLVRCVSNPRVSFLLFENKSKDHPLTAKELSAL